MPENADPMSALREAVADIASRAEGYRRDVPNGVALSWAGTLRAALRASLAPDRDAEIEALAEAMDESFWPDDLPFVDDRRGFWLPFAAKVVDFRAAPSLEGARHPEAGEPEPLALLAALPEDVATALMEIMRTLVAYRTLAHAAASPGARYDVPGGSEDA